MRPNVLVAAIVAFAAVQQSPITLRAAAPSELTVGTPVPTVDATTAVVSDRRIAAKLRSKLFANPHTRHQPIRFVVRKGVVTLTGRARDHYATLAAEQLARATAGVVHVVNRIEAPPPR